MEFPDIDPDLRDELRKRAKEHRDHFFGDSDNRPVVNVVNKVEKRTLGFVLKFLLIYLGSAVIAIGGLTAIVCFILSCFGVI